MYWANHPSWGGDSENIHIIKSWWGGARGVMVIVVGNGHDDPSSNPGRDWLHFT